jgi:Fe-S cluster assembly iron-binding protein IscA
VLTVTNEAKQLLLEALLANTDDPEIGLRLALGPGGQLALVLDKEAEGDQVVEHKGSKVLLVGAELAFVVDGVTIDVRDTEDGPRLIVLRPDTE